MEWIGKRQLLITPPSKPKKITGTRFASILGLDKWNTPFKTWCAITKTYEDPFVDNKFTIAGKAIEPNIIAYLNKTYFFGDLKTPTDIYGADYFSKTWGDFYPKVKVFGGMWDALYYENGKIATVIEIKTTKRAEDWKNGAPTNYALQAALYTHLLGVDDVCMVVAFLEDKDYEHPELFVPCSDNTITDEFSISERFPNFQRYIDHSLAWWEKHVVGGISPEFDESSDADVLKALRTNSIQPVESIASLVAEAEKLKVEVDTASSAISKSSKRLEAVNKLLKAHCMKQFREGDTRVALAGSTFEFVLSRTEGGVELDVDKLKADGLFEKYNTKQKEPSYRFTNAKLEGK